MEQPTQTPQEREVAPSAIEHIDRFQNTLERQHNTLEINVATLQKKEGFMQRLEQLKHHTKTLLAGATLVCAASGAFAQEATTPSVDPLDGATTTSTSFGGPDKAPIMTLAQQRTTIDAALTVAGEALTAAGQTAATLATEGGTLGVSLVTEKLRDEMSDPRFIAKIAKKAGGTLGQLGNAALSAQHIYETGKELRTDTPEGTQMSTLAEARKMTNLLAALPLGGNIAHLANMANKTIDAKEALSKGEQVSAGTILEIVASFIPQARILVMGAKLLGTLSNTPYTPPTQDLYKN